MVDFKYNGRKEYAQYYIEELVAHLGDEITYLKPDVIIPIPVHPSRRRQRGYNQAELIAKELSKKMQIHIRNDILIRTIKTRPQKELSNVERIKNLERAFSVKQTGEDYTKYQKVLLIDDIYTTGSTIEACAKVLQSVGMREIYFVTLCIGQGF